MFENRFTKTLCDWTALRKKPEQNELRFLMGSISIRLCFLVDIIYQAYFAFSGEKITRFIK